MAWTGCARSMRNWALVGTGSRAASGRTAATGSGPAGSRSSGGREAAAWLRSAGLGVGRGWSAAAGARPARGRSVPARATACGPRSAKPGVGGGWPAPAWSTAAGDSAAPGREAAAGPRTAGQVLVGACVAAARFGTVRVRARGRRAGGTLCWDPTFRRAKAGWRSGMPLVRGDAAVPVWGRGRPSVGIGGTAGAWSWGGSVPLKGVVNQWRPFRRGSARWPAGTQAWLRS